MEIISDRRALQRWPNGALVPTMGALHDGHASLIREARRRRVGPVLVSIFVNPTQFAPHEDFARYPRTLEADSVVAKAAGADVIFAPPPEEIYPDGPDAAARAAEHFPLPQAATTPALEDRIRPGHFGGVCLVVARLFELAAPRVAIFGEKDWQQWRVIDQMAQRAAADAPIESPLRHLELSVAPTVREHDGLAMSSRNRYLSAEDRRRATAPWRAIQLARELKHLALTEIEEAMTNLLVAEGFEVDYAVIREEDSLNAPGASTPVERLRALVAARVGGVRLIDNAPLHPRHGGDSIDQSMGTRA
ncbi:MAG: pantoate--beta-alanine ligase [Phycisphaeraceae bacterium]|nr:pantoate--beta-alanine ligase [Phycisphaeraceae bacterium]